jgi:hypothetical protein
MSSVKVTGVLVYRVSTTISIIKYFQFTRSKLKLISCFLSDFYIITPSVLSNNRKFFPFFKMGLKKTERIFLSSAWQRPTLTGTKSQLPSALRSLTSVFGMGTGVTFSPLLPDYKV